MSPALTAERSLFLSTLPAERHDRRLAIAVVAASVAIFVAAVPFAKVQLPPVGAFIPIYESALVINDLITAVLLFGQYRILRSRALLLLAGGYLFTAFIAAAHAITFPGLFSPTGLLGAGPQSTAWLYMFWHGGFPVLVIAYTLLDHDEHGVPSHSRRASVPILCCIAMALLVVTALTMLATMGQATLPPIMEGNHYTGAMIGVVSGVWVASIVALVFLWRRRRHTVLDVWLMVVMCAWVFDIALSAVLNAGRFDLGFYGGRIYGLLASSFVLLVLLLENGTLYARLAEANAKRIRHLRILREIDRAIAAEELPEAIAAAVIQPLRELLGVQRVVISVVDLAAGEVELLVAAGRRRTHIGRGVRHSIRLMGDIDALRRGEPQVIDTHALSSGPEVHALLASGIQLYMAMPMIAGGELIGTVSFGGKPGPFPADQVNIAREVATQLAIAITQARLYARIKRHAEELELRVEERTSEMRAANKELEAFSYSVSHDLRAPLRAVDGYARMLEEDYGGKLDAEGTRLLAAVRANSRRMGQLIDDLLAFSRLGRTPLRTQPVKMEPLVQQIVDELRADVNGRKIEFAVGALGRVEADPSLLKHALSNLLSNAIKFTRDTDSAVVEVGRSSESGADDAAVYYVKDNGAGFDMKYYEKLFGVFQRLHSSVEFPGTGVGLAIVQRVINRHGGRIWADAKPGEGATFYFTLQHGSATEAHAAST